MGTSCFKTPFLLLLVICAGITYSAEECGVPFGVPETGRIVGGYPVGYYKYPWFATLIRGESEVYCGATLIKDRYLLTAAHCFRQWLAGAASGLSKLEDIFTIKLGIYDRCKSEDTQKTFKAKKVHVHEKYKKKDPYYDIALIELDGDTSKFAPACLPRKSLDSKSRGKEATVQGFGNMKYGDNTEPCTLREARVLVYDDEVCKKMLKKQDEDPKEFEHAFCAGYLEGGIDACQGDSGGPLLVTNHGRTVLMGVTSFGFRCADKDVLGLYTDVSRYLDWINQRAGNGTASGGSSDEGSSEEGSNESNSESDEGDDEKGDNDDEGDDDYDDDDDEGDGDDDYDDDDDEGDGDDDYDDDADEDGDDDYDDDDEGDGDDDYDDDEGDGDDDDDDYDDDEDGDEDYDDDDDYDDEGDEGDDEDYDEDEEKPSKPINVTQGSSKGGPFQAVILQIMNKHKGKPTKLEIINGKKHTPEEVSKQVHQISSKRLAAIKKKLKKIRKQKHRLLHSNAIHHGRHKHQHEVKHHAVAKHLDEQIQKPTLKHKHHRHHHHKRRKHSKLRHGHKKRLHLHKEKHLTNKNHNEKNNHQQRDVHKGEKHEHRHGDHKEKHHELKEHQQHHNLHRHHHERHQNLEKSFNVTTRNHVNKHHLKRHHLKKHHSKRHHSKKHHLKNHHLKHHHSQNHQKKHHKRRHHQKHHNKRHGHNDQHLREHEKKHGHHEVRNHNHENIVKKDFNATLTKSEGNV